MTMFKESRFVSPAFILVTKGLVELHRLIKDGKDETPEAEAVRNSLDSPLKALNPIEKERARWLSEDLYSVSEPESSTIQKEMSPQALKKLFEALEARRNREWDRALILLRDLKDYISPTILSDFRGSIWLEAGNPDAAAMFYGYASEKAPEDARYLAIYLHTLEVTNPTEARRRVREILADDQKYAPVVVARAADIHFKEARTALGPESTQFRQKLIPILERNIARIEQDEGTAARVSAYLMTAGLLGFCYEFLGNAGAAANAYSLGLQVDPMNDGLLVARGILQYGSSPRAIADFEEAVRLGSVVVWPYLFLAHHYLITNRFDECRVMCEMGLKTRSSDTSKSRLEEWRAISQAELGFPPELVRAAFEDAVRLDPSNDFARRNQIAFEASLKDPQTRSRLRWEQKSNSAIRQFGLVESQNADWRYAFHKAA